MFTRWTFPLDCGAQLWSHNSHSGECSRTIMAHGCSVNSNLCTSLFASVSENRSVVLASTAIQLLDERKSPIAAGRWLSLSHTHTLQAAKLSFSCCLCGLFSSLKMFT